MIQMLDPAGFTHEVHVPGNIANLESIGWTIVVPAIVDAVPDYDLLFGRSPIVSRKVGFGSLNAVATLMRSLARRPRA
jgi:hypothetical protein